MDADAAAEPAATDGPRWGGGDVALGILLGILGSVLTGVLVVQLSGHAPWAPLRGEAIGIAVGQRLVEAAPAAYDTLANLPIEWQLLSSAGLWLALGGVTVLAVRVKGSTLRDDLGLAFERRDVPFGLALGAALQLLMVPLIYLPLFWLVGERDAGEAARDVVQRAQGVVGVLVLFLIVAVIAPVVEELFYRGLAQRSFSRRLGERWGLVAAAALFAVMHLQSLQFLPLLALGVVCGVLTRRYGRLGPAIWTHVGFNLVTAVLLTIQLDLL